MLAPAQPPTFFATPAEFRTWLCKHHASAKELLVGFHKKGSGTPSITWPESVDEALCVGWIDAVRRNVDASRYSIRFTARKAKSTWSAVNIARVAVLTSEGRMQPAGLAAFAARTEAKSGIYAYEQTKAAELDASSRKQFRANATAWKFFNAQAPSYRQRVTWWLLSARQEVTRQKRLAALIAASESGKRL